MLELRSSYQLEDELIIMATDQTLQEYEAIRRSGKTNMMEKGTVQRIAYECDYHSLVMYIEDHDNVKYMEMAEMAAKLYRGEDLHLVDPVPDEITFEVSL